MAVDGGQLTEEVAVGDGAPLGDLACGSSCNQVLEAKGDAVVPMVVSGSDGRARRWPVTASTTLELE
jgi:hypothetical protein